VAKVIRARQRIAESILGFLLRPWLGRPRMTVDEVLASAPKRILLVRAHDQIGDMIVGTPAFSAVRSLFPDAEITLVCMPRQEPVVRHHPALDRVLTFDRRRTNRSPREAWRFLRELRGLEPDGAFVLNTVSFSTSSALVAALSGARWIVGGDSGDLGWKFVDWIYSIPLPQASGEFEPAPEHALRQLRRGGFDLPSFPVVVGTSDGDDAEAARFIGDLGGGPVVAMHPGAGKARNVWPARNFARVVEALEARGNRVWIVEGPADREAVEGVFAHLGSERPRLSGVDLCVVAAALRASDAVLVNDTSVMHLAGGVGARGVAMFATTPSEVWAPRTEGFIAIQSKTGQMDGITPDEVLEALATLGL
jgi:ADP-heptose:LPS heptosyltransferase